MKTSTLLKKKRYLIPTLLIVLLIAVRLALPSLVKNYINKTLNNGITGYTGHVNKVGISLYRGAYQLYGFTLKSTKSNSEIPFLYFPKSDISIHWKALLRGSIVSEITLYNPKINYVKENQQKQPVSNTKTEDWSKTLTNIVPIDINKLVVNNGEFSFVEVTTSPKINLEMKQLNLLATNLKNVRNNGKLPSTIKATGVSAGNGKLVVNGKLNLIKEIPDLDISVEFTDMDITALNPLTNHYANIDFEKGSLSLYSEIAIANGFLEGYLKPITKNTQVLDNKSSFLNTLWEGFVGFIKTIFTNPSKKVLATKIPLKGNLTKVDSNIMITIGNIFKNAWIEAFKNKTDNTVNYQDVVKNIEN